MFDNSFTQERAQGAEFSNSNSEVILTFEEKPFEYVMVNGEPMFNLNHVADILDIQNPRMSIDTTNEKYVMKLTNSVVNNPYNRNLNNRGELFLTETGLYKFIFASRNPNAAKFQDWVCGEVLPSIRKHGAYMTTNTIEDILSNPDTLIRLATDLKNERLKRQEAEQINKANAPKVRFADACLSSDSSMLIKAFALYLQKSGIKIGQLKFYEWLRNNGYLYTTGEMRNMPVQEWLDKKIFDLKKSLYWCEKENMMKTSTTTMITEKGQMYFLDKLKRERDNKIKN